MRVAVLACLASAAAVQADPAEDLLRRLRSESIDERSAAEQALGALGEAARPALERAAKDPDVEVARRAGRLLRLLDLRGRLSPAIRERIPNVEQRLVQGGELEYTAVFLEAGRLGLPTDDLAFLAPAAIRGAKTPVMLTSVCEFVRARAIRTAMPQVLKLLENPDANVSRAASRCLPALDGPELRRGLLDLLESAGRPAPLRLTACDLLLKLEAREILPAAARLLADPDLGLRRRGLSTLVQFEAREHAPAVLALLADPQPAVRAEAVVTLRRLDALETVPALRTLLADPRPEVRVASVRALEALRARGAVGDVAKLLEDPLPEPRAAAAWAVGAFGASPPPPALAKLLQDEDAAVRAAAVWALGRTKAKGVDFSACFADADYDVRRLAAWAVGVLDLREAAPRILGALEDTDDDVRASAARTAGRFRLKEAVPALRKMLEAADPSEQEAAVRALGRIGAREALPSLLAPESARKKVILRNRMQTPSLRPGAFEALRFYAPEEVLSEARTLLEARDLSRGARVAAEALRAVRSPLARELLTALLALPEDDVRDVAARALGEIGAREAVPRLLEILEDENADARGGAAHALSLLGIEEALPALRRGVQEPDRDWEGDFVRALERFGDDLSRDFVVAGLPEYREEGVYAAAMWLCREGRKVAIQPVLYEGDVYTPLNGLRRPAEWGRLCAARLEGGLEGSWPELAERIGAAAGLAVEWHAEGAEPDVDLLMDVYAIPDPDGRLTAAEALLALVRLTNSDYEALLEPGRLRIVPWDEAEEFWDRWGPRALREK